MQEFFLNLWAKHSAGILDFGRHILAAVLIIIVGRIVVFVGVRVINRAKTGRLKLDETIASILKVILTYGILLVCIIMILENFGFNTTSLIALLGAAGVAIGLALRGTLSNIASGIVILLLRPFRKGDFIEFGASMGYVRDITLYHTVLETSDGVYVTSPNSVIWGGALKNYSRSHRHRMELPVCISGTDSIDTAVKILQALVDEKRFLASPAPQIEVKSHDDNGTQILLKAWVPTKVHVETFQDQMKTIIEERMKASGLTIHE